MAENTNTPSEGVNVNDIQTILDNHYDDRENYGALRDGVKKTTVETLEALAKKIKDEKEEYERKDPKAQQAFKEAVQEKMKAEKNVKEETVKHLAELVEIEDQNEYSFPLSENQKMIKGWLEYAKPYVKEIPLIGGFLDKMMDVRGAEKIWYGLIAKFGSWIPKEVKEWLPDDIVKGPETWANANLLRMNLEETIVKTKRRMGEVIRVGEITADDLELLAAKKKEVSEKKTTPVNLGELVKQYIERERKLHPRTEIVITISTLFAQEEQEKELREKESKERLLTIKNSMNLAGKVEEVRFGENISLVGKILTISEKDVDKNTIKTGTETEKFVKLVQSNNIPEATEIAVTKENTTIEWIDGRKKIGLNMKDESLFANLVKIAEKDKKEGMSIVEIRSGDDLLPTEIRLKIALKSVLEIKNDPILVDAVANHFATLDAKAPSERDKTKKWNLNNGDFIPVV